MFCMALVDAKTGIWYNAHDKSRLESLLESWTKTNCQRKGNAMKKMVYAVLASVAFATAACCADSQGNIVWDGGFSDSAATAAGIYLRLNGNSVSEDGNTITIDSAYGGIDVNQVFSGTPQIYETVIFRYRCLKPATKDQVVVAAAVNGIDYDRAGYRLTTDGQVGCVWNPVGTPNAGGQLQPWEKNGDLPAWGSLPERGYIAFTYGANMGATIHYRSETDEEFASAYKTYSGSQYSQLYLHSINDNGKGVWGVTVGGCRQEPASLLVNAKGMKITGIAHINTRTCGINDFKFASSVSLDVSGDEAVSSINGRIPDGGRVLTLRIAADATIDLDEPFACDEVYFASEGSISLSAELKPTDEELEKFDFRAVAGGVSMEDWKSYLSNTGEYLTEEAQPAFRGMALSDLSPSTPIRVRMGGGWLVNGEATLFCRSETRDSAGDLAGITYLAQRVDDGFVKAVAVEFTQVGGDVWARAYGARNTTTLADFGKSFTGSGSRLATGDAMDGYGLYGLALAKADDCRSISINFTHDSNSRIVTPSATGAPGYEAVAGAWNNVAGVNGSATVSMGGYVTDGVAFAAACGTNLGVAVSGSRGSYHNTATYPTSGASVLRGYIDENSAIPNPSVTITNIPFDTYRVVVYCSTDTTDAQFGHVTVNGVDYSAADGVTTKGSAPWGMSRMSAAEIGTNVLVSDVTCGSILTVVGHRGAGEKIRGCVAAVQIVKSDIPIWQVRQGVWSDKGTVSVSGGKYVIEAKSGETLTEGDFSFAVDKAAYRIAIAPNGESATVMLNPPAIATPATKEEAEDADPSGLLANVAKDEISAPPTDDDSKLGAVAVESYKGLYYQAAWGDDLDAMTTGEKVLGTGEPLYLGVVRQVGGKGFYKVTVGENP